MAPYFSEADYLKADMIWKLGSAFSEIEPHADLLKEMEGFFEMRQKQREEDMKQREEDRRRYYFYVEEDDLGNQFRRLYGMYGVIRWHRDYYRSLLEESKNWEKEDVDLRAAVPKLLAGASDISQKLSALITSYEAIKPQKGLEYPKCPN